MTFDGMQEYYADVKARMQKCDRDPDTCKILFGMQPIVGETEESAQAKADFHNALLTVALDMSRGVSVPQVVGAPEQIADWMQETMEIVGGDSFILSPLYLPGSIEEFGSMVVPVLQRRGLVRTQCIDGTLRDNLLAF